MIGQRISRLDGIAKSTGKAKYNSDINPPGLLFGVLLTSPHAHCRITSIDTGEAEKLPGVTAIRVIHGAGANCSGRARKSPPLLPLVKRSL